MILITDGGSTKCDWIAINSDGSQAHEKIRTKGLNPAIISEKKLRKTIKKNSDLKRIVKQVKHIHFYGAGCGTSKPRIILHDVLKDYFPEAQIEVKEDTYAAVRACISNEKESAIVCILGTGSNCSFYDGNQLHQRVDSLGYTLMDDASGNYFGKQLIRDYYFNKMPATIKLAFAHKYNLESDYIKYNLYKQANPSSYLASHAEFMFLNKESKYIKTLIKKGITLFARNMILQFKDEIKKHPVHFAGSIAFFAQNEIIEVANTLGFQAGNFVRRPIDGLVNYHSQALKTDK